MSKHKVVIVEGIIGVGKSEFSRELARALGEGAFDIHEADQETAPDSLWNEFYAEMQEDDETKWKNFATLFQLDQLSRRFRQHNLAQWWVMSGRGSAILDRSYFEVNHAA